MVPLCEVPLPGRAPYPLAVTASGERLWVTARDISSLVQVDRGLATRRWKLPRWPHTTAVDANGRVWTALTWKGRVAVFDPVSEKVSIVKLARSREILGLALDHRSAFVVDSGNRLLWTIDQETFGVERAAIPGSIRPDIPIADAGGHVWITDTQRPTLMCFDPPSGSWSAVDVPDGTRLIDEYPAGVLSCTATRLCALITVEVSERRVSAAELPGVPFGVASSAYGVAVAVPSEDVVVVVQGNDRETVSLPAGARPHDVAWWGSTLAITCPGRSVLMLADL